MEFIPTGNRRLTVALYALTGVNLVEILVTGGISQWGAIAVGLIVLTYFSTKFAEAMAGVVPALITRIKG
jgi:hypothetical protein